MDMAIIVESIPRLLNGVLVTLEITGVSVVLGFFLAVPLSIMRVSKNPFIRLPVYGFNFYFRGTPPSGTAFFDLLWQWTVPGIFIGCGFMAFF